MSCEWIKQEPLEENEMQFEAGLKQEIPPKVEETHHVKVEDGNTSYKMKEDFALEGSNHVNLYFLLLFSFIHV